MKIPKDAKRNARRLFRGCFTNNLFDEARARAMVEGIVRAQPRHTIAILSVRCGIGQWCPIDRFTVLAGAGASLEVGQWPGRVRIRSRTRRTVRRLSERQPAARIR